MNINEYYNSVDKFISDKFKRFHTQAGNNSTSKTESISVRTMSSYGLSSEDMALKTNIAKMTQVRLENTPDINIFPLGMLKF